MLCTEVRRHEVPLEVLNFPLTDLRKLELCARVKLKCANEELVKLFIRDLLCCGIHDVTRSMS